MSRPTVGGLRAVPPREWPALVAAASVAVLVEIGLRTLTLPRLARLAGAPLVVAEPATPATPAVSGLWLPPRARLRLRATRRVMRHWPFGDTCLRRALVSGQRLHSLGPVLRVGVAKIDGQVRAHAWLEIDGASLDPAGAAAYDMLQSVRPVRER